MTGREYSFQSPTPRCPHTRDLFDEEQKQEEPRIRLRVEIVWSSGTGENRHPREDVVKHSQVLDVQGAAEWLWKQARNHGGVIIHAVNII